MHETAINKLFANITAFLICVSESVFTAIIFIYVKVFNFLNISIKILWSSTKKARARITEIIKNTFIFIVSPFIRLSDFFKNMKSDISSARQKGTISGLKVFFSYISTFVFGKHGIAITLFNHAAPVISIIFLFNLITYTTSINYAVKLTVNGLFLGYVDNEQVFYDAEQIVEQRLNNLGSSKQYDTTPVFTIESAGYSEILTSYQIADLLLQNSNISVDYAYGIFINGIMHGAVTDNTQIKKTLDSLLQAYKTNSPDEEIKFLWEINCDQTGLYTSDSIIDTKIIIDDITAVKSEAQYYTVQYGDSQSLIGDVLDMTQAEIEALNPGFIESELRVGDKIMFTAEVPALPISHNFTENYEQSIPYPTQYIDSDDYYEGTTNIKQPGENGMRMITARVTEVNGVETEHNIINETIIYEPVTEVIIRGTKQHPRTTFSNDTASYGKFIWPIKKSDGGKISEYGYWNGGYSGHVGIDFAAPYGTPVYAGDSGVVTLARWYYDYGNLVIIQHDNGLTTYYAHNSSIEVYEGQRVTQGQCIALVGQTGRAYGNHVHFEVRSGNSPLNPIYYIDIN